MVWFIIVVWCGQHFDSRKRKWRSDWEKGASESREREWVIEVRSRERERVEFKRTIEIQSQSKPMANINLIKYKIILKTFSVCFGFITNDYWKPNTISNILIVFCFDISVFSIIWFWVLRFWVFFSFFRIRVFRDFFPNPNSNKGENK